MDLVPLRIAALGGSLNGVPAAPYVAAGFTLLQRAAPVVRALKGRRSALLLDVDAGPAVLVALAASDGRCVVVLNPSAPSEVWRAQIEAGEVGAVFTTRRFVERLVNASEGAARGELPWQSSAPSAVLRIPIILLDDAPALADLRLPGADAPRRIDLGSHFGLDLVGTLDDPLRDEPFIAFARGDGAIAELLTQRETLSQRESFSHFEILTHRDIETRARDLLADPDTPAIVREVILPLLSR